MAVTDILGRTVATIGESLGLPEMGISERITGVPSQTVPLVTTPGGAYTPIYNIGQQPGQPTSQAPAPAPTPTYTQTGQVLGATAPTAPPAPAGPSAEELERQRREAEARAAIESGYSGYFAQLDAMLNEGLPTQEAAQKGIATSQWEQGAADLLSQLTEGERKLGVQETKTKESQARNLRDIATNLRNAMMAGQVFLGAHGAGDSSAARMYSYALTKLGSKQRGDIMRQGAEIMREIGARGARLQNIYTEETNRIKRDYDQKILSIQQWFGEQQNAIRQAYASGEVAKGTDLASLSQTMLNQALGALNQIRDQAAYRTAALEQWAINNATTIQQLRQNMAAIGAFQPVQPTTQPIVGQPTITGGHMTTPARYIPGVSAKEEEEPLFGQGALSYRA